MMSTVFKQSWLSGQEPCFKTAFKVRKLFSLVQETNQNFSVVTMKQNYSRKGETCQSSPWLGYTQTFNISMFLLLFSLIHGSFSGQYHITCSRSPNLDFNSRLRVCDSPSLLFGYICALDIMSCGSVCQWNPEADSVFAESLPVLYLRQLLNNCSSDPSLLNSILNLVN